MRQSLKRREQKWRWAQNNPDKAAAATARWRQLNADRVRRGAAERMRRYRERRKRALWSGTGRS
jgi:hypothetical protein